MRSFVWFPCIDEKVERAIKRCRNCQANVDSQHFEPILSQPMPLEPWSELSCDFFGPLSNGKFLFVVIDDHSRYPVVKQVSSTSAKVVLPVLEEVFCMFGVPRVLRSDNGPPFSSFAFRDFARHQGFTHRRTTQLWPRANGLCERFMRCQGKVIRNAKVSGHSHEKELLEFLRTYRATPHASTGFTPNELLFKSSANTSRLPSLATNSMSNDTALKNDANATKSCDDTLINISTQGAQISKRATLSFYD